MTGKRIPNHYRRERPLVFLNKTEPVAFGEIVLRLANGDIKNGQVLDTSDDLVIVQVFEGTAKINRETGCHLHGRCVQTPREHRLGLDEFSMVLAVLVMVVQKLSLKKRQTSSVRPSTRTADSRLTISFKPAFQPLTAVRRSSVDRNSRSFSASGLPHNDIALQIARQAKLKDSDEEFIVVFCAMGITAEEYNFFRSDLERTGALENAVLFVNLADDPAVERIITPRLALTVAEYLAFEKDYHVLVIYTDMTNYCDACDKSVQFREEVPGRRGYPGYMYTDLGYALRACRYREGRRVPLPSSRF